MSVRSTETAQRANMYGRLPTAIRPIMQEMLSLTGITAMHQKISKSQNH